MTFDETAPYPRDVLECASDKEMEESIFIDEELQGIDSDEDESLLPSTSSPELVPASTHEAEAPQAYYLLHSSSGGIMGSGGDCLQARSSLLHSEGTSTSADHR
jgi:hypothetical protein